MPTGVYKRNPEKEAKRIERVKEGVKNRAYFGMKGIENPAWKGGIRVDRFYCVGCGKDFDRAGYFYTRKIRKYCSVSCASKNTKRTKEWYAKVSESLKSRFRKEGLKSSSYVGFTRKLKFEVRKRDNFMCRECVSNLDVHHIDYDKTNNDFKNLISLCKSCHSKTNFSRLDWKKYYQKVALMGVV